ncbi:MAG TPA: deoxynucleoside kinase [Zoogloea sp.]|jgi:deoxyadenosine/deoxycytidine kinase|uniref:deoxynucleoside kinase n=1 Tax=Zoogloea sp. TaxID=49181 RepID=UPI001B6B5F8B|nr:deoxynucleoside kinase [Zoogloea sp.]MBP8265390.1 deoxynucleoside kinase [Zoogloea sp.]HOB44756.1 deoxynucleoside kinase [Zoogloea sp.]HQA09049.1 deoxynucleoside kinase [Zoogloea sp.]HQE38269.1 deoxynucleoside kinase [Zoogloea sp.]
MLEKARYIVVEGPIGAGKTTLAKRLADRINAEVLLENPAANPFLGRFYQNMERWGLPTQIAFLFQRSEQLVAFTQHHDPFRRVVSDFLIEKDPLFAELNLAEDELHLYRQLYERLKPTVRKPDLVIYLQAQPDILIDRVRRRGVESERKINEPYLQRVAESYATFFHHYDAAPLFIVNAESLNPVDKDEDFELLYSRLIAMRSYREFFGYAG